MDTMQTTYKRKSTYEELEETLINKELLEVKVLYLKARLMRAELAFERIVQKAEELQARYDTILAYQPKGATDDDANTASVLVSIVKRSE